MPMPVPMPRKSAVRPAFAPDDRATASVDAQARAARAAAANAARWQPAPMAELMTPWATWPMGWFNAALELQQAQYEGWLTWQRGLWTAQQEAWERWQAHFAGGAPIDG